MFANLVVALLDRCPGDAKGRFFLPVALPGVVKRLAEDILGVLWKALHSRRQIIVPAIGHPLGSAGDAAINDRDDPVSRLRESVIVRDGNDGSALLPRQAAQYVLHHRARPGI